MSNFEYSSYSSSGGVGGGANQLFQQADTNKDGALDKGEFANFLGSQGVSGGQVGAGFGGASGGYGSSSYESSNFSSNAGGLGVDAGLAGGFGAGAGFGGASSYESSGYSTGAGFDGAALGGANYQSSSFESSSSGGLGFDASTVSQAAGYTSETNAAWSKYGAEVRGAGLYVDANPQIIRRQAPGGVQTYTQNIKVRFLQPPAVPPPGPLIIKEVRPPQPPVPPPLRIKQQAPPLPQPPPLVLRERPPQPPASQASQTVIRKLAALPVPPRSVIIERLPAAPAKPRDIIIERWVPYGAAAKRKTVVQRAEAAKGYTAPKNVIIQYEQAQVRVVRQFQRLGVTQANPQAYLQQYGAQLLDASSLVQQARAAGVVEDISPPAVAGGSFSSSSASFGQESFGASGGLAGVSGGLAGAEFGVSGGDLGGVSSQYSSSSFESSSAGGFGGAGLEGGLSGSAGLVGGAGFVGGADLVGGASGGYGSSSYESSSYSSTGGVGGATGGFDVASAAFNSADTNKDGSLNASEFNNFVQGGL